MRELLLLAVSYLVGCVVGAYYIVRLTTGRDVRDLGSGNAGARNVLRTVGKVAAGATLVFDTGKGAFVVWLAQRFVQHDAAAGLAFLMVVAGHIWPAQLGFRGGKGAATALGCMLVIDPVAALLALVLGGVVLLATRHVTASGLSAVAAAPLMLGLRGAPLAATMTVTAACAVVLLAHRRVATPPRSIVPDAGTAPLP